MSEEKQDEAVTLATAVSNAEKLLRELREKDMTAFSELASLLTGQVDALWESSLPVIIEAGILNEDLQFTYPVTLFASCIAGSSALDFRIVTPAGADVEPTDAI
jgi:hypothetical protein